MAFLDEVGLERLWQHIVAKVGAYETKDDADSKLAQAKSYADQEIAALVNSAPETLDTIGELAAAMQENEGVVEALNAAVTNKSAIQMITWESGD